MNTVLILRPFRTNDTLKMCRLYHFDDNKRKHKSKSAALQNENKMFSSSAKQRPQTDFHTMNIFDRNAKLQQKRRTALDRDYKQYEYIKEEVGWRTADRVFDIKRQFTNAVDLGCSRGYVSRHLTPDSVSHVTLVDSCQELLDQVQVGEGVHHKKLVMDEEKLDLPENSADLVVSSLCLHWINDLPGCFDRIYKCLKPDGVFIGCMFGGDTLFELRSALQLAETERQGGFAPHVSPFVRIRDVGGLLNRSGFTMPTIDSDEMVVWYPSLWQVAADIRGAGEAAAAHARPAHVPRETQFAAAAIYDELYGKEFPERNSRGVPATYQIVHFVGWKPDPSQPKPMDRGTGQVSLKDLHRIDEIAKEIKTIPLGPDDK